MAALGSTPRSDPENCLNGRRELRVLVRVQVIPHTTGESPPESDGISVGRDGLVNCRNIAISLIDPPSGVLSVIA